MMAPQFDTASTEWPVIYDNCGGDIVQSVLSGTWVHLDPVLEVRPEICYDGCEATPEIDEALYIDDYEPRGGYMGPN